MSTKHGNSYRSVRATGWQARRRPGRGAQSICVESLEPRNLLSGVTVTFADGVVTILGTADDDQIDVVLRDWKSTPMIATDGTKIAFDDARALRIYGMGGNDSINVWRLARHDDLLDASGRGPAAEAGDYDKPVTLDGGNGDDRMLSESGTRDVLQGSNGFDWARSDDGNDSFQVECVERRSDDAIPHTQTYVYRDAGSHSPINDPFRFYNANGQFSSRHYPEVIEPEDPLKGVTYTFDHDTGIFTIVGTDRADAILVYAHLYNDLVIIEYGNGAKFFSVDRADFKGIQVFGGRGNDGIEIARRHVAMYHELEFPVADVPVTVHGGAGDDEIYCETTGDDVFYGDEGRDRIAMVAGNDLFSSEEVDDYRSEYAQHMGVYDGNFYWAEGGEHLFGNPWAAPVGGGTYYVETWKSPETNGVVYPWGKPEPEPQPAPQPSGGEIKPYVPPAHEESPAPEPPPIMPMGTPSVMFSMKPIADDANDLWN